MIGAYVAADSALLRALPGRLLTFLQDTKTPRHHVCTYLGLHFNTLKPNDPTWHPRYDTAIKLIEFLARFAGGGFRASGPGWKLGFDRDLAEWFLDFKGLRHSATYSTPDDALAAAYSTERGESILT